MAHISPFVWVLCLIAAFGALNVSYTVAVTRLRLLNGTNEDVASVRARTYAIHCHFRQLFVSLILYISIIYTIFSSSIEMLV